MVIIKGLKAHALVVHERSISQNPKSKQKCKENAHVELNKEGYLLKRHFG
jgi:hypothetical protein